MPKREFLLLAYPYDPKKCFVNGWYASEKLDGIRCFWDAGITCGLPASEVPWANTAKHARLRDRVMCTGLWTRYCQPIQAPADWISGLPAYTLDGELTLGRGKWQETSSVVRSLDAGMLRWQHMHYAAFDSPLYSAVFADGRINGPNCKVTISDVGFWLNKRGVTFETQDIPFYKVYAKLKDQSPVGGVWSAHQQITLPSTTMQAESRIAELLTGIESLGGEGLILRNPVSSWKPERSHDLLKVKTLHDDEGVVVGYRWGKETDVERSVSGEVTNKLLGLMGCLRLRLKSGAEFDLSGFTHEERRMCTCGQERNFDQAAAFGRAHPGEEVVGFENPLFPIGSSVTFKYRELSDAGIPKEARYWRRQE